MRVLITIGYQRFLLPSDKGAAGIIHTLAKALPVAHYQPWDKVVDVEPETSHRELTMEYVPDNVQIIRGGITVKVVCCPSSRIGKSAFLKLTAGKDNAS